MAACRQRGKKGSFLEIPLGSACAALAAVAFALLHGAADAHDSQTICRKSGSILVTEIAAVKDLLRLLAAQKSAAELAVAARPGDEVALTQKLVFDDFYREAIAILKPSTENLNNGVAELSSLCRVR